MKKKGGRGGVQEIAIRNRTYLIDNERKDEEEKQKKTGYNKQEIFNNL